VSQNPELFGTQVSLSPEQSTLAGTCWRRGARAR
jgi:hypothetical protein